MSAQPPRPVPLSVQPEKLPGALRSLRRFVTWTYTWKPDNGRPGKWDKPPFVATSPTRLASSTNPDTWRTFDEARRAVEDGKCDGMGIVLGRASVEDPAVIQGNRLAAVDLDHCVDSDGVIAPWAQTIIAALNTYAERSPSGEGIRLLLWTDGLPPGGRKKANVEMYDGGRYVTLTGQRLPGPTEPQERTAAVAEVHAEAFGTSNAVVPATPRGARPSIAIPDDRELIERAHRAQNGSKFAALWAGDISQHSGDDSAADLALCNALAFWTDRDSGRMDRLFRQSGLMRNKWDRKLGTQTYGERTISRATADCVDTFGSRPSSAKSSHGVNVRRAASGKPSAAAVSEVAGRPETSHVSDGPPASPFDGEPFEAPPGDAAPDGAAPAGRVALGQLEPTTGRLLLSPRQTLPTAEAYVGEFHVHEDGRTLVSYANQLLEWRGNRYTDIEDEAIKHRLQPWLHNAVRYVQKKGTNKLEVVDFDSNPTTITQALESIRSFVHLPRSVTAPGWLNGRTVPPAGEILCCRSANVHIPTRCVLPATPALFTTNALEFDYEAEASPPLQWLTFLHQLWPEDEDSIALLQEWFGYLLTADTSQQKMLFIKGPKRSGKGTIGRVLRQLIGPTNMAGPTTASLAGQFGLQDLIGKSLAIVSDARFTGDHISQVMERLLCISGEDTITVERKFLGAVDLKLPTRFVFLSNELPRVTDSSGALPSRFCVLALTESFYGREDKDLDKRLFTELPSILLWAMDGWQRLHERGRFTQPESSEDEIQQMEDLASPVSAFVRECCVVGPAFRVTTVRLFDSWKSWCEREGRTVPGTKQSLGRDLGSAITGISRHRGSGQEGFYQGIGLKDIGA